MTSANAVPALAGAVRLQAFPVFAVGERTAALLEGSGLLDVRRPAASGGAGALAALIGGEVRPGAAVLLVGGRDRKAEPERSLRAVGYTVAIWDAYAAVPASKVPAALVGALQDNRLDAALHYSRRSAAVALKLVDAAGLLPAFVRLAHHALSLDVAEELAGWGVRRLTVSPRPDERTLLATLGPANSPAPASDGKDGTNPPEPACLNRKDDP